jgi:hypothetical protein
MATQPQLAVDRVIPWMNPYEYILNTNQGDFVYIPKDIVNKGYVAERYEWLGSGGDLRQIKEKRQYFHPEFLNQDFLSQAKTVNLDQGVFTDEQKKALSDSVGGDVTNGYLFPAVKYFETVKPSPTFYSISESAPPISGIKTISDQGINEAVNFDSGYKYVIGEGNDKQFDFINPDSSIITLTAGEAPSGGRGKLGKELRRAAIKIGQVPFLTQATAFIPVVGPYVYSALRGAQMGVAGKDPLEAGVQVGAEILLANAVKSAIGGTPVDVGVEPGTGVEVYPVDPGVTPDVTPIGGTPVLPPVDYGLLGDASLPTAAPGMGGGTNAYDSGVGLDVMNPPPAAPPMTAEQLAASNIDPLTREGMSAEQITKEAINSPYYRAAQSNIDPSILEGMSAGQVASAPVLTSAGLASGAAASTIGLSDAVRGLRTANSLLNPAGTGGEGGVDSGGAQQSMGGVDYSGLYNLLAQRAIAGGLLGTRYQPQPVNLASLLG